MSNDSFSQKEMLVQIMVDMRATRDIVNAQGNLLTKHIEASNNRDEQIRAIKVDVERIEERLGSLEIFKTKALAIWGGIWSVVTLVLVYLMDKVFG